MRFWTMYQDASGWKQLREAVASDPTSRLGPEAQQALVRLRMRYHGATQEALEELNDPNFPFWVMRRFGVGPHEVGEVIQAVKYDFGLSPEP